MKTCTTCKEEKPLDQYHNHYTGKSGKHTKCKVCTYEQQQKSYRKNNLEKVRESVKYSALKDTH